MKRKIKLGNEADEVSVMLCGHSVVVRMDDKTAFLSVDQARNLADMMHQCVAAIKLVQLADRSDNAAVKAAAPAMLKLAEARPALSRNASDTVARPTAPSHLITKGMSLADAISAAKQVDPNIDRLYGAIVKAAPQKHVSLARIVTGKQVDSHRVSASVLVTTPYPVSIFAASIEQMLREYLRGLKNKAATDKRKR